MLHGANVAAKRAAIAGRPVLTDGFRMELCMNRVSDLNNFQNSAQTASFSHKVKICKSREDIPGTLWHSASSSFHRPVQQNGRGLGSRVSGPNRNLTRNRPAVRHPASFHSPTFY